MTVALSIDPLSQFGDFAAQVGVDPGGKRSADQSRVDTLMAESLRALRAGDTTRFNALLTEIRLAAAPQSAPVEVIDASDWIEASPPLLNPVMTDTFEAGDKVEIIGAPKVRKSFFALQMAMHIAAGLKFLAWDVPTPRRVLLVQLEVKPAHFHRRVRRMAETLGMNRGVLQDNLHIINGRGKNITVDGIVEYANQTRAELVIFDPLYKLVEGEENNSKDMKPVLASFDRLCELTGAAVVYVHHDAKGRPGDRDIRDRGAGSNVMRRDADCTITLTSHRDDPDAVVIEALHRNYKPQDSFTIGWCEGSFRSADLAPVAATSRNVSDPVSKKPAEEYVDKAVEVLREPISMREFSDLLTTRLGLTQIKARSVQDAVIRTGRLKKTSRRFGRGGPIYIGKPADIEALEAQLREQKLPGLDQGVRQKEESC